MQTKTVSKNVVSQDKSSFNSSTTITDKSFSSLPPKRTRSGSIVQDKTKCIWSFKGPDKKHSNRKSSKLHLISSLRAWPSFIRHTILLKGYEIRMRITTLIDFHWFWYRSFCYWSAMSSQLQARTCVSSSYLGQRSPTLAKCLPDRSKMSFLQASKGYILTVWNQDFAKFSKRIYDNYRKL